MAEHITEKKRKKAWKDLHEAIYKKKDVGFADYQAKQFLWFFLTDLDRRIEILYELVKAQQELIGLLNQQIENQQKGSR